MQPRRCNFQGRELLFISLHVQRRVPVSIRNMKSSKQTNTPRKILGVLYLPTHLLPYYFYQEGKEVEKGILTMGESERVRMIRKCGHGSRILLIIILKQ